MNRKAMIFGIRGHFLNNAEKILFKKAKPWGIILFSRNIKNISQLKKLVNDIKILFNDKKYPILIDQEGGRVSRLNKIIDLSFFSQNYFGEMYSKNKNYFYYNYKIYINAVSDILKQVGININTVPVLDIRRKNTHKIIGDRSFSENTKKVVELGNLCIDLYTKNKIGTIIKHIPGHGLAKSDSHINTPIIKASEKELSKKDFIPFNKCKSLFAMTAHVIYSNYDTKYPVTHSKTIIKNIIRDKIKFDGLLISDDISMKSLKFKLKENVVRALDSGCNLILHCNGNIKEMIKISQVVPKIDKFTQKKTSQFYKFLG